MTPGWYLNRLRRMSPGEIGSRVGVALRQRVWAIPALRPDGMAGLLAGPRAAKVALRRAQAPPPDWRVIAAADALLDGQWPIFTIRPAAVGAMPDWFRDPLTGRTAPRDTYAFAVPYRDEAEVGNIKYLWEMSRHQATTMLAAAWWMTGEERYAARVAEHLTSWWAQNPFLQGVHWTSGIEAGLRLLSWTWIRALLAEWPGVRGLFDDNPAFIRQLHHHLRYLAAFRSRGSSANNHLIAELAGVVAACAAFPWFRASARWGSEAMSALAEAAAAQTGADGWNREQASEYHLFVFEMLAAASLALRLADQPGAAIDGVLGRMADALAASLDAAGHPPRFGDGDDGRGLLLDAPDTPQVAVVLDVARALFGAAAWWPSAEATVLGHVAALFGRAAPRDMPRTDTFADIGMTLLRAGEGGDEIYLRCDAGPHGFLSIAAHGHADALSLELRCGGVEILADPGTYCYHGEPEWRALFRGTLGHNTLTVDDADQARPGGPFLWLDHPRSTVASTALAGSVRSWQAWHDGYARFGVAHHRHVVLDTAASGLCIEDWIDADAPHRVALAFHLGPAVEATLEGAVARLRWPGGAATLDLPTALEWRLHRGETTPPLGWYSDRFGQKQPAIALVGRGSLAPGARLQTRMDLSPQTAEESRACAVMHAAS